MLWLANYGVYITLRKHSFDLVSFYERNTKFTLYA